MAKQNVLGRKVTTPYLFMGPYMLVFIVFTVLPVLLAIGYSFTDFNILQAPGFVGWNNYRRLFTEDAIFLIAIKNTLLFAAITGPVSYLLCLFCAWLVNELAPRTRAFMTMLFYAPSLANIYAVWKLIFSADSNGFLNNALIQMGFIQEPIAWLTDTNYMFGVVIFVVLWSSLGTSFLSFIAGLQNVDKELFEAGAVDGVRNRWQELWFITLPQIRSQMLFGAVMSISSSFGIGGAITSLVGFPSTGYAVHTAVHHMEDYGTVRLEMGYACAIATLLFIIMVSANKIVQNLLKKVGT